MRPIISIVGKSSSGKTTLLGNLIAELKKRGYKIATIKHASHDFELDQAGKDSWQLTQAGSEVMAISSPHQVAIIKPVERDLAPLELSPFIPWDYDLILTEGFKQADTPKIEVHRKEQGKELLSPLEQLLAVVTDEMLAIDVPQFSKDEIQGLADLIEKTVGGEGGGEDIELSVNNTPVSMNLFVRGLLARLLVTMVSSLNGVNEIKSLHIILRRKS